MLRRALSRMVQALRSGLPASSRAASTDMTSPAAAGVTGQHLDLLYLPGFRDRDDLADQYHRMLWYVHPLHASLGSVQIPVAKGLSRHLRRPDYLDPDVERFTQVLEPHVQFFDIDDVESWRKATGTADVVLQWREDLGDDAEPEIRRLMEKAATRTKRWRVDRHRSQFEGSFYLKLSHDANPNRSADLARCEEKFAALGEHLGGSEVGYLYGTGPSLSTALERDVSDGISIACNSMVKNQQLLDHLQPRLVVIGDPIFHAGPSSYAGEFRRHLLAVMERYDSYLVVPFRDYKLYLENLPTYLRPRIVGIPFEAGATPNLDLTRRLAVTTTSNILTLFLIPLAATFFRRIGIMGCDGRPLSQNDYFWTHDPKSQFNDHMQLIQRCHPAFFSVDYDAYYLAHCETLEKWLREVEAQGIEVENLTPSHIPALQARTGAIRAAG